MTPDEKERTLKGLHEKRAKWVEALEGIDAEIRVFESIEPELPSDDNAEPQEHVSANAESASGSGEGGLK